MDGEKEVAFGVVKDDVVEKCDFQDLKEANGVNHVNHVNHVVGGDDSGSRRDSVDDSYVFVSGNHNVHGGVDSKESDVVPNGDTLDASVPGDRGLGVKDDVDVDESVDVRTVLAPSGLCVDDVVPLEASSESLDQDIADAVLETSEVESLEVDTGVGGSVELKGEESFFGKSGDRTEMIEEAVSRESFELRDKGDCRGVELNVNGEFKDLKRAELEFDDTRDEIKETTLINLERSDDVPRGLDSGGGVLVASAESGQSEDLEGLALGVMDSDNHKNVPRETNIEKSDSQVLISRMNAESGESKDLENVTLVTNDTSEDNKESMDKIAETSDMLSAGQDPRDVSGSSDEKETGDEYKESAAEVEVYNKPIGVQECVAMDLNHDQESDISRESVSLALDVQESGDEDLDKQCETSDDLTEVQGATNTIEPDEYQLEETESEKFGLKEKRDPESFNHNNDEHESKVMVSEAPACQLEDENLESNDKPCELSDDLAEVQGASNAIEADGYQLEEIESEKLNLEEQNNENESKVMVLEAPACHSEDVKIMKLRPDLQLEAEKVQPLEEGGTAQIHVVVNQVDVDSQQESDSADIQDNLIIEGMQHTINKTAVGKNELDPVLCQNEFDSCAPKLNGIVQQHDEPCEQADGSVKILFGSLRTETAINSKTVVADHEVVNQSSALCGATKLTETESKPGKTDQDLPSDCQNVTMEPEIELQSPKVNKAECTDNGAVLPLDDTKSRNIESGVMSDNGVPGSLGISSCVANEAGLEAETMETIDTRAKTLDIQELEEAMQRPFNFLVKLPRFDDGILREQIRLAQREVDEKTRLRDALRVQIQNRRHNLHAFGVAYDAAGCEEIDARKLLKATRIKIESLQSLIGRMKNAISVEDIDATIYNIEHQMQHETLSLKEEKQSIREIKQLKQHREYLSANVGSQDEIQQALDQKDQNEDRLKALKKELVELKEKVSRAQTAAATAGKKYENENTLIQELQNQYRVANDVRQAAYENLLSLKKQLYEKHGHFRKYKNDISAANDYAFSRNKIGLNRLCVGQTEMMMELWNKNEEFREEYVRCNLRSTVRRLGTVDGRSLSPNEEPPLVPSYGIVRVDRSTSNPNKNSPIVETAVEKKIEPKIATVVVADHKPVKEMTERFRLDNGEKLQEEEEHDLARKSEDSLKEVETAALKEEDRLDEIAKEKEALERKKLDDIVKAKEALERKKRLAEKAQIRAELRAQKEAEQREKEREKRLRKKERRRTGTGEVSESNNHGEIEQSSEDGIRTIAEPAEAKENPGAVARKPQKASHFVKQSKSKPLPPGLRNRNRKKLQQWMYAIVTCVLVIALFLLGNLNFFTKVMRFGG